MGFLGLTAVLPDNGCQGRTGEKTHLTSRRLGLTFGNQKKNIESKSPRVIRTTYSVRSVVPPRPPFLHPPLTHPHPPHIPPTRQRYTASCARSKVAKFNPATAHQVSSRLVTATSADDGVPSYLIESGVKKYGPGEKELSAFGQASGLNPQRPMRTTPTTTVTTTTKTTSVAMLYLFLSDMQQPIARSTTAPQHPPHDSISSCEPIPRKVFGSSSVESTGEYGRVVCISPDKKTLVRLTPPP